MMKFRTLVVFLNLLLPLTVPGQSSSTLVAQDNGPLVVTLQDAIVRAKNLSPEYHAALTDRGIAREDKVQALGALLPNVSYSAGFLYTKPNPGDVPRFIANNATREYTSLGNAHE